MLLYDGIRKCEGLKVLAADTRPDELAIWLQDSKNGDPRMLKLRQDLADRLKAHLGAHPGRERLFKFRDGGHFKHLLLRATLAVCGLPCPARRPTGWKKPKFRLDFVTFHVFRHTWATWMRYYGGAYLQGLAGTRNWKDLRSVARYSHVVPRDEWDRVDSLPSLGKIRGFFSPLVREVPDAPDKEFGTSPVFFLGLSLPAGILAYRIVTTAPFRYFSTILMSGSTPRPGPCGTDTLPPFAVITSPKGDASRLA